MARVFVAVAGGSHEIAAFYTLSAGTIERATLAPETARRLPHYPLPVALIGLPDSGRRKFYPWAAIEPMIDA